MRELVMHNGEIRDADDDEDDAEDSEADED